MDIREAHASGIGEVNKYDSVYSLESFSIAENRLENKENPIKSFKHKHEAYEFIIPLSTIPLLYYDKAEYIGEVGYIYPVNPFVEHGLEVDLQSEVISIVVERGYLDALKKTIGYDGEYFYTRFLYKKRFLDLLRLYEKDFSKNTAHSRASAAYLAKAIASMLIEMGLKSKQDNRRPESIYAKNMKSVLLYIEEHFQDPELSILQLAALSGYSPTYFSKAFKGYMHTTPIMHLNKRRISHANMLLRKSGLSLQEIAAQSGYRNLSAFTEAFKRVTGMLPSLYRKQFIQ